MIAYNHKKWNIRLLTIVYWLAITQVRGDSSARLQHWGKTHIENLHKDSTIWGSSRNCKVTLPKRNPGMLKQHLLSMKLLLLLSRKDKKMLMMLILIFLFLCWNLFVLLGLQRTVCRHLQLHVKPLEGIMWGIYAKTIVNLLINALLFYAFHFRVLTKPPCQPYSSRILIGGC